MALTHHPNRLDGESQTFVTHALRADSFDASEDGTGRGTPLVINGNSTPETSRDLAFPLRADDGSGNRQAIAFSSKDHGADAGEIAPTLRAMGHSGSHANAGGQVAVAFTPETMYGVSHADAAQTGPDKALRALRNAVGEEAFSEWGLGVVAALRPQEILRSDVHGQGLRRPAGKNQLGLDDCALSRQEDDPAWTVQRVWEVARLGRAPRRWQPSEQLVGELGSHLSELPHQTPSTARLLLGLWRASEGLGLLRQALSTLQAARRPAGGQDQPAQSYSQVRRLTPREAERLQGFPDDYTLVPYRNKPAADGPRYKALGNSMAVPVVRWIGQRIAAVRNHQTKAA
jgi:DNA (cytosine-5)-methyltransferase 1